MDWLILRRFCESREVAIDRAETTTLLRREDAMRLQEILHIPQLDEISLAAESKAIVSNSITGVSAYRKLGKCVIYKSDRRET